MALFVFFAKPDCFFPFLTAFRENSRIGVKKLIKFLNTLFVVSQEISYEIWEKEFPRKQRQVGLRMVNCGAAGGGFDFTEVIF